MKQLKFAFLAYSQYVDKISIIFMICNKNVKKLETNST